MKANHELPVTAYLVLALLAEGETHGYELQRRVHDRGFRFWTDINRASIYSALKRLQKLGLVTSELREGGGPARKVFRITAAGRERFQQEGVTYLATPSHPRNESDLGVLALPYLDLAASRDAVASAIVLLRAREAFVVERLQWCRTQKLDLPMLNFDRPVRTIRAELQWLEALQDTLAQRTEPFQPGEWEAYVYAHPPHADDHER